MFSFPPQTAFGKPIPKSRIYTHAAPSRRVKELFVSQLSEIIWAHKLSPETLHIPASQDVPEIQIFDLHLKTATLDDDVLHTIDKAVPYPVIHRLHSEKGTVISAAFKRPSEADSSQWVVGSRFTSAFTKPRQIESPLPAAIHLGHLYAALLAPLLPLPSRAGESLASQVARCEAYLRLRRQIDQLTSRLHREKQFNRKVEINQQIKPLQAELALLTKARDAGKLPSESR